MITIFQGEDVAANSRVVSITFPTLSVPDGFTARFFFNGVEKCAAFRSGGRLRLNYSHDETARFPLGISYGSLWIEDAMGLRFCVKSAVPILVTDCAERTGDGDSVPFVATLNVIARPIDVEKLEKASTISEVKAAVNAIVSSINEQTA